MRSAAALGLLAAVGCSSSSGGTPAPLYSYITGEPPIGGPPVVEAPTPPPPGVLCAMDFGPYGWVPSDAGADAVSLDGGLVDGGGAESAPDAPDIGPDATADAIDEGG